MSHKVALLGRRSDRTPLAYDPYQKWFESCFELVSPAEANVFIFAMAFEIKVFFEQQPQLFTRLSSVSIWLVSEEPLWDTVWNRDNLRKPSYSIWVKGVEIKVNQISHFVRSPYEGLDLPYFLTTSNTFYHYYNLFFRKRLSQPLTFRNPSQGAGLLEFRTDPRNDVIDETGHLIGLSNHRVRLAQFLRQAGQFEIYGAGWSGKPLFTEKRRQDAFDFHLQKLVTLESNYGFLLAIENTLQNHYLSEKLFDALAVGALPLYYANPEHDVFNIVPERGFVNLYGKALTDDIIHELGSIDINSLKDRIYEGVRAVYPLFEDFTLVERTRQKVAAHISATLLDHLD